MIYESCISHLDISHPKTLFVVKRATRFKNICILDGMIMILGIRLKNKNSYQEKKKLLTREGCLGDSAG